MPVYITDEDALDRMVAVEGERWRSEQARFGCYGFTAFLEEYRLLTEWLKGLSETERAEAIADGFGLNVDGNGAIYGSGGWHRYFVRYDGEIVFSRHHARVSGVERAEAAGFRVTGTPS